MGIDFEKFDHENVAADMRKKAYKKRLEENPRVKVLKKRFPIFPTEFLARTPENEIESLDREWKELINKIVENNYQTLEQLGHPLKHSLEQIQNATQRVCSFFQITADFFLSKNLKTRTFLLLGLIDQFLSSEERKKTGEKGKKMRTQRKIFDQIKLILIEEGTTWSKRILSQAQEKKKLGRGFLLEVDYQRYLKTIQKYCEENLDKDRTAELNTRISFSNKQANPLAEIRAKHSITKINEKPFSIKVVSENLQSFMKRFGFNAVRLQDTLIVPNDIPDHLLEHEYIHTQFPPFIFGSMRICGRGLSEARAESLTKHPTDFSEQREILDKIIATSPKIQAAIEDYEKQPTDEKLDALYLSILESYGTRGLTALLTLLPAPTLIGKRTAKKFYHGTYLFSGPKEVMRIISKIQPGNNGLNRNELLNEEKHIESFSEKINK